MPVEIFDKFNATQPRVGTSVNQRSCCCFRLSEGLCTESRESTLLESRLSKSFTQPFTFSSFCESTDLLSQLPSASAAAKIRISFFMIVCICGTCISSFKTYARQAAGALLPERTHPVHISPRYSPRAIAIPFNKSLRSLRQSMVLLSTRICFSQPLTLQQKYLIERRAEALQAPQIHL